MNVPAQSASARLVAFVCPDCDGPLSLHHEPGSAFLTLSCAVGHRYSLGSLVEGKEERLQQLMWMTYRALEELARLMEEILALDDHYAPRETWAGAEERRRMTREHAERVRAIIESNAPVGLGDSPRCR